MMRGGGIRTNKKAVEEEEEEEVEEDLVFRIKENHYNRADDPGDENDFGSLAPASSIAGSHSRETLQVRVGKWSDVTGQRPCAIVYVAADCFHLHKEAISRCGYLRKQLTNASVVTVNHPLNITAQTFLMVAEFCYGADIVLSPDNLAALRIAAQLLEMTEDVYPGNLIKQTENYFLSMVTSDQDYASIILNSSVELMPEAETVASLVSRCLEVLGLFGEGDMLVERVEVVRLIKFNHFKLVAQKLRQLLPTKHDTLYIVIDQFIKGNVEKLTEEDKSDLCSLVDCVKLEPHLLIHAVQCPRMPLRFIVRAMFADQINARSSIISATSKSNQPLHHRMLPQSQIVNHSPESVVSAVEEEMTLGGILQRDAAIRHVEQIKQEMEMTSSKIKQLEEELKGMKTLLTAESEQEPHDLRLSRVDSRRCTSLRILTSAAAVSRVQRNERGSVSAMMLPRSLRTSSSSDHKTQRGGGGKGFGAKLFSGLRSVFRGSGSKQESESTGCRVGRKPQQKKPISR